MAINRCRQGRYNVRSCPQCWSDDQGSVSSSATSSIALEFAFEEDPVEVEDDRVEFQSSVFEKGRADANRGRSEHDRVLEIA